MYENDESMKDTSVSQQSMALRDMTHMALKRSITAAFWNGTFYVSGLFLLETEAPTTSAIIEVKWHNRGNSKCHKMHTHMHYVGYILWVNCGVIV